MVQGDAYTLRDSLWNVLGARASAIVSGLIALVLRVYSDRPAAEIVATEPDFIQAIGLAKHLSPTRSNGLAAMLAKLKGYATAAAGSGE